MMLLIDMNLSPRWSEALGAMGIEAVHWRDVGDPTAPDGVIFDHATREDAIVLTADLDFGAILAVTGATRPSVIQLRGGDLRPEANADAVVRAIREVAAELAAGALLTVDAARCRVTLLPLRR